MGNMLLTSKELEALGEDPMISTYNIDKQMEKVLMTKEQREAERKKEDGQKQAQKDAAAAENAAEDEADCPYFSIYIDPDSVKNVDIVKGKINKAFNYVNFLNSKTKSKEFLSDYYNLVFSKTIVFAKDDNISLVIATQKRFQKLTKLSEQEIRLKYIVDAMGSTPSNADAIMPDSQEYYPLWVNIERVFQLPDRIAWCVCHEMGHAILPNAIDNDFAQDSASPERNLMSGANEILAELNAAKTIENFDVKHYFKFNDGFVTRTQKYLKQLKE